MQLGVCVASDVTDIGYIVRAEELGYSHAWLADSQMIWSDCYATLALAASQTKTISIGTGVAVAGTRPAPVNAAGIATINAIAPGRTFMGVGAGNTALRMMGEPPQRIAEFDRYLETLRPLLRGDEAEIIIRDEKRLIRHVMPDRSYVNFEDKIPLYVSGFGPRSLGLAGRHGDGAVLAMPPNPQVLEYWWSCIEDGAREAGRSLERNSFYTCALTTISVLDPGETADSPRIRAECGAMAMATIHFAYDQWRQLGKPPPRLLSDIWDDYCAMLAEVPEERLHQRIHAGHNCWVLPEEERFVTRELIEATCMVGSVDDIVRRLDELAAVGLDQVMILPASEPRFAVLERVATDVLTRLME
jgi:alkanesulfonate monooxygenase SsuD/methylene tetrahydromethanopterin reductase-like flavin-dependent oxidoreductase (luciferase family)